MYQGSGRDRRVRPAAGGYRGGAGEVGLAASPPRRRASAGRRGESPTRSRSRYQRGRHGESRCRGNREHTRVRSIRELPALPGLLAATAVAPVSEARRARALLSGGNHARRNSGIRDAVGLGVAFQLQASAQVADGSGAGRIWRVALQPVPDTDRHLDGLHDHRGAPCGGLVPQGTGQIDDLTRGRHYPGQSVCRRHPRDSRPRPACC